MWRGVLARSAAVVSNVALTKNAIQLDRAGQAFDAKIFLGKCSSSLKRLTPCGPCQLLITGLFLLGSNRFLLAQDEFYNRDSSGYTYRIPPVLPKIQQVAAELWAEDYPVLLEIGGLLSPNPKKRHLSFARRYPVIRLDYLLSADKANEIFFILGLYPWQVHCRFRQQQKSWRVRR